MSEENYIFSLAIDILGNLNHQRIKFICKKNVNRMKHQKSKYQCDIE